MNKRHQVKRIAVLYSELSGYMAACLRVLKDSYGIELLVFRWPVVSNAPFEEKAMFGWIDRLYDKGNMRAEEILGIVEQFEPDGLFIPGWMDADYLKVARVMKRRNVPVIAGSDTQWTGSLRQRVSKHLAPWYLHTAIDVLWVAGERQRQFARYLGYAGAKCWSGLYACDWSQFAKKTTPASAGQSPFFLYVGRYIEAKGLDVLVNAYKQYRQQVETPWELVCAGTGVQADLLKGVEGIQDFGFQQPTVLPELLREAGAFVLPSRTEPWGVALQEAAASGLPLISSTASGAAIHLVQDGYNGYLFESGDAAHLAACMARLSTSPPAVISELGQRSYELAKQFTPARWAETLVAGLASMSDNEPVMVAV